MHARMGDDAAFHVDSPAPFRLFSRERNAWLAVALYVLLLYATLTLTYDLYMLVFNSVGQTWVRRVLTFIFIGIGILLVRPLWRRLREDRRKVVPFTLISGILIYALLDIQVPSNQIHFLQYGPLAFLVFEALRFRVRDRQIYPLALAIVLVVGVGDEFLQSILPDRRFDFHDVVLNAMAGMLVLGGWGFLFDSEASGKPGKNRNPAPEKGDAD